MKTVSIVIPTYNEEDNICKIYERIMNLFTGSLSKYSYEIIFIDNCSTDSSRNIIEELCGKDKNVKAIFNSRNFGFNNSLYYGILQSTGDCTVLIFCDMQDPPEVIPEFVHEWENGYKIVVGIKDKSYENKIFFFVRTLYYKLIHRLTDINHINHYNGFGLYDKSCIAIMRDIHDAMPYFRGIVAEIGLKRKEVRYTHDKRKAGKSKLSFMRNFDVAMLGITSYSKVMMRLATITGFLMSIASFIIGMITFEVKLINWEYFEVGFAAVSVGMFFLGSVLLFFLGLQGEYVQSINIRVMDRPLVIEEKRINFDTD